MQLVRALLKWLLLGVAAVTLGVLAFLYVRDPVLTTRLLTLNMGPEARVKGGEIIDVPVLEENQRTIDPKAIEAAIRYGEETGSHALLVYRSGSLEIEHYYPGYDATTLTPTQSMHKSVLAMLVGIAIEQGYILSVDTPASTFLPEWANDERSRITIRQLLQQVSGIDFATFSADITSDFFQMMMGENIRPIVLNSSILFPPDTEFDHNSINPEALGIIIERASGQTYADYLSSALWQRIGVPDATVVLDSEEHGMARTFCCLQATARSWLNVGLLHLQGGAIGGKQVVPANWMRAIATPGKLQPNYGYLTWLGREWNKHRYYNRKTDTRVLHSEAFAAPDIIYFDGMGGQRVYIIPSARMIIVRTGDIVQDWDDSKLPNILIRGMY